MKTTLNRKNQTQTIEFNTGTGKGISVYKYYTKKQLHEPKVNDILLRARNLWTILIAEFIAENGDDEVLLATIKIQVHTLWPRERYARDRTIDSANGYPAYMTASKVVKFLKDNGVEANYYQF